MRSLSSALLALFLLAFSSLSGAAIPKQTGYTWSFGSGSGSAPTAEQACAAGTAYVASNEPCVASGQCTFAPSYSEGDCQALRTSPYGVTPYRISIGSGGASCPANSTANASGACDCQSGFVEQGDQCVNPNEACQADDGKLKTVNFTLGWARSAGVDAADYVGKLNVPDMASAPCVGGCRASFDQGGVLDVWRSQEPSAQGLYRISGDYRVRMGNVACTPGEQDRDLDPNQPDKPCPGYVGVVNGKTVCVGTADKPIPPPQGDTPSREAGKLPDKANPSAGPKPESGEGSGNTGRGRTPANGNGGNSGGPASAAGSGSGSDDGTTDKPEDGKEQQNCGAPGQPPCKLDESGTPGTFSPNNGVKDYKDKMDQQREQIKGAGDGVFGGLNVFFSAPPVVGCTPFTLPNEMGAIDPCGVVDGVRAVMAYLWAIAALWLCPG